MQNQEPIPINSQPSLILLVNFGGPRNLEEIEPFLCALLTDKAVMRTPLPGFLHRWLFTQIAKKRALKIRHDYIGIGGKSPIFEDTEQVAGQLRKLTGHSVFTFHRYLPMTHPEFLENMSHLPEEASVVVFPFFPQFSTATTGSIQSWFSNFLSPKQLKQFCWIDSYATHPAFISCFQDLIREALQQHQFKEEKTLLLFSPHGLPQSFIRSGDPYEKQCHASFECIIKAFPKCKHLISFQSKFGPGEWLRPYTNEVSEQILDYCQDCKNVLFIPLSFTSDHIETLFEIEKIYVPNVRKKGLQAARCSAFGQRREWVGTIKKIVFSCK